MPTLHLQLFGDFRLVYNDAPVTALNQARLQALLAYLVLHQEAPQARQRLAYLFWPDSSDAQARANLRQLLHRLQRALPDAAHFLQMDANTVQWRPAAPFLLDVAEFAHHLTKAATAASQADDVAERAALQAALPSYQGDLLAGCYDDWVLPERERWQTALLKALERLMVLAEAQRDYPAAIDYAQRLLRHDPLHEITYRHLMRLHALAGDRAGALRVYHTCATILQRELDVEPSLSTRTAYEQLLHLEPPAVARPIHATPHAAHSTQHAEQLIGRQAEWQTMLTTWQGTANGRAHCLIVAGEAGIGKTRLAEALATWVSRQGLRTAHTRAYAAEGALAYAPVTEWLRTATLRAGWQALEPVWLTELTRLLPELLSEQPHLSPPAPVTESWQRKRLFEALARAVQVNSHPLLLVLDDLQWCDRETLEWLHYLLRYAPQAPLLVVGTVRPEEVNREHPLTTLLLELRSTEQLTELELGPLNRDETAALAGQITGQKLASDRMQRLYQETEGNPLFVVETARMELSKGVEAWESRSDKGSLPLLPDASTPLSRAIASMACGWQCLPSLPHCSTPLSPKVQAVIQRRLGQLSLAGRELASLAAVIGRSFAFQVLVQASDQTEDALVRGLDELWQRRIIREQGVAAYDFSHDRIREVAYAGVSLVRRRLLHRRVAQALEQMHGADLDAVSGQIAVHYELAGLAENAVLFYQRAATVAQQVYAHAEATRHLNQGVALLRQLAVTPDHLQQELRLQFALGVSLAAVKGISASEVREVYVRAQELATQVGDNPERLVAVAGLHISEITRGQIQAAYKLAVEGLTLAERIGEPSGLVEACGRMGTVLFYLGQWQASRGYLEQALAQTAYRWDSASLLHWPHHQGITARRILAFVLWHLGYPDQAQVEMEETLVWAQKVNHPYTLAAVVTWSAWFHLFRRELTLAQAQAQRGISLCQQQGYRFYWARCAIIKGWALVQQGQSTPGIAHMQEGLAALLAMDAYLDQPAFLGLLAAVYDQAGQPEQGQRLLDEALDQVKATDQRLFEAELHRLKGELLWVQGGDEQEVEAQFLQALSIARQQEAKALELRAAMSLARLWQSQGKRTQAYDLLTEIYGWFTEGFATPDLQDARALIEQLAR